MIPLYNILFIDIETVSQASSFDALSESWKALWGKKAENLLKGIREEHTAEQIYERAALYAEFGKIICISCGVIQGSDRSKSIVLKSFYGDDEKILLSEFGDMLNKWAPGGGRFLCAHNGKEFDYPYLCRRMIVNGIDIPPVLTFTGKKPWEMNLLDTMDLWKFGDYKNFTSLHLLANVLDVPTSKDDIDGSMVGRVYWQQNDLDRIVAYCQKDVVTLIQVYLRMTRESPVNPEFIEIK